jgi:hypothetical protein
VDSDPATARLPDVLLLPATATLPAAFDRPIGQSVAQSGRLAWPT